MIALTKKSGLIRPVLPALVLALGFAAAVGAQTNPGLFVTPNPAPANKAFQMLLQGVAANCYTTFTRESVMVSGARIDLRYTSVSSGVVYDQNSAVCPMADAGPSAASLLASMPVFSMPALKAGKYEVWATLMPECLYSEPSCKIAVRPDSVGILTVQGDVPMTYMLNPAATPAGKAFALQLLSYGFTCATAFDQLSAVVSDGVITLSFSDQELPKGCMDAYNPYGPTFQMPALKAGSYKVKVNRLQLNAVVDAGVLLVTGATAHTDWYLKEHTVAADKAFAMQLLRDDIGNCQTAFSHESVSVVSGALYASFVMESHPERVCVMDLRPFGPSFSVPALKAGIYPVYPEELAACQVAQPPCYPPVKAPVATDTLVVTKTAAISLSRLRAEAPQIELRAGAAIFSLPAGAAGEWRAVLATLDGRILSEARVAGAPGERVSVPVRRAPAHALSLLRLISPDGGQSLLPILK